MYGFARGKSSHETSRGRRTRVCAELSRFIENLVSDPDREEPPALKDARTALEAAGMEEAEAARMYPREREYALIELDDLPPKSAHQADRRLDSLRFAVVRRTACAQARGSGP